MTAEQSDVRAYLKVLWRWKVLVVVILVVIPDGGIHVRLQASPRSTSRASSCRFSR